MSFWNLSEPQTTQQPAGTMEMSTDMEPIPAKTQLKAAIDEAKWDDYDGEEYISFRWQVLDGEYKGRKVFQKVKVCESDAKKRDKAIKMLQAIDFNSQAGLMQSGARPGDADLQRTMNKPMLIMVQVWAIKDEQTGDVKKGNWINSVAPLNTANQQAPQQQQYAQQPATREEVGF